MDIYPLQIQVNRLRLYIKQEPGIPGSILMELSASVGTNYPNVTNSGLW